MKTTRHGYRYQALGSPGWDTPHTASLTVGTVVYFIRCLDGCIKIGYTKNLANRVYGLGVEWMDVLAITPGGAELESNLHDRFAGLLARGNEYFNPGPDLLVYVNKLRDRMGVPPVAPWQRLRLAPLALAEEFDNQAEDRSEWSE